MRNIPFGRIVGISSPKPPIYGTLCVLHSVRFLSGRELRLAALFDDNDDDKF